MNFERIDKRTGQVEPYTAERMFAFLRVNYGEKTAKHTMKQFKEGRKDKFYLGNVEFRKKSDWSAVTREINVRRFFKERQQAAGYEDFNHEEWARREKELGITERDWEYWNREQQAIKEARYRRDSF